MRRWLQVQRSQSVKGSLLEALSWDTIVLGRKQCLGIALRFHGMEILFECDLCSCLQLPFLSVEMRPISLFLLTASFFLMQQELQAY